MSEQLTTTMSSALITPIAKGSAQVRGRSVFFRWSASLTLTSELLKELIASAVLHPRRLLVVDLRAAQALDPQILEWLEQLSALADSRGVRVRVVSPRGSKARRLLSLLRFDRFMVVVGSVLEAIRIDPRAR